MIGFEVRLLSSAPLATPINTGFQAFKVSMGVALWLTDFDSPQSHILEDHPRAASLIPLEIFETIGITISHNASIDSPFGLLYTILCLATIRPKMEGAWPIKISR